MAEFQPIKVPRRAKDLTGKQFGKWTILYFVGSDPKAGAIWLCQCECGKQRKIIGSRLIAGGSKSCGCRPGAFIHGMYRTKVFKMWKSMRQRCENPRDKDFRHYGGRGISVCQRWRDSFSAFFADMGDCPEGLEIDRIDNDGNYEPGNCRYVTHKQNVRNTRCNHLLTYHGKTQCLSEWANEVGLTYGCLKYRIYAGWTIVKALTTPTSQHH